MKNEPLEGNLHYGTETGSSWIGTRFSRTCCRLDSIFCDGSSIKKPSANRN